MNHCFLILLACCLFSCTTEETKNDNKIEQLAVEADSSDVLSLETARHANKGFPLSGAYQFDVAFAEWDGKSLGNKVTVIVDGDYVKVIYEGIGSLTATNGEVLDEGKIMQHKSG